MTDPNHVTRAELAETVQSLRGEMQAMREELHDDITALREDLNAAIAALTQRLDRHERWLQVLSTGQVVTLLLLLYLVAKLGL